MKHHVIVLLLFLFPSLFSMELESDLVPLLDKKSSLINERKDVVVNDRKHVRYGCLPEKLYLARRIPGLLSSKNYVCKKIIEYMVQTEPHLNYEISLHYQTKIDFLRNTMNTLTAEKNRCPDITINTNRCIDMAYAAAQGGCYGAMGGCALECTVGTIQSYAWLCCNVPHNKCMWDLLIWGCPLFPSCGCLIGLGCVMTGLYDKIKCEW